MNYLKIVLAVAFLVAAQNTPTFAQSSASPSDVQKTDEYSKLGDAWNDKCLSGNCVNGKGERGYRNGDRYEGDFVSGRKVGKGTYTFSNGDYYVGQWKNDKWNGEGRYYVAAKKAFLDGIWANGLLVKSITPTDKCVSGKCVNGKGKMVYVIGDTYEGDFVAGTKTGVGTYTAKDGQIYVGQFAGDKFNGRGKVTFANGETYEGDWLNNERSGKGKARYNDGANYDGDWLANKWNGQGRCAYANGDIYNGNWINGVRDGKATYYFKNGNYYIGSWKNDLQHGEGRFFDKQSDQTITGIWKDGVAPYAISAKPAPTTAATTGQTTFEGGANYDGPVQQAPAIGSTTTTKCISGNCLNGYGKFAFPSGEVYEGTFVNGSANGKGTLTYVKGNTYVGDFAGGRREGFGKYTYPNGTTYEGGWVNNQRSGQGTFVNNNGEVYVGQFANDKRNGKGRSTYKNGDTYDGDWVDGLKEGQATYTFANGSYYIGGFKSDKQNGPGKQFNKLTNNITEGTWKDGAFVNTPGVTKITLVADAGPKLPVTETKTLLRETLNGKFDYLDKKPLTYIFTNKKTNEVLRYQIEFIDDGGKLAFRWKESTKKEQSEKLVITDEAIRTATKYIHFFSTKTAIAPDKEIAFILSQKLHKDMKAKEEISLDLGGGVKRLSYIMQFTASSGTYTDKNVKVLRYQADDVITKIQILDDPICPLIVKIETAEYTLSLV